MPNDGSGLQQFRQEGDAVLPGTRRGGMLMLGVLAAMGLAVVPFASVALPQVSGFMPAFGGMVLMVDTLTAVLLLIQARVAGDRAIKRLGLAYTFSVAAIVPHLLAFPGVLVDRPIIGDGASAVWLWCVWHGGFALCVIRYALTPISDVPVRVRLLPPVLQMVAVVLAATLVCTVGRHLLPTVLSGGSFAQLNAIGVGPAIAALNLVALLLVIRLRRRSAVDAWLAVAMLAAMMDVLLTLVSGGRYTVGWYVARCLSLATGTVVLIALLSELTVLFSRQAAANRQLRQLSMTDALTLLSNRRAFDDRLSSEWRRAAREGSWLSLAVIDIDFFKRFNDRYGHPAGDRCLQSVSRAFESVGRRGADLVARLGGEEFIVILPDSDVEAAKIVAERLRRRVADAPFDVRGEERQIPITVSVGVSVGGRAGDTMEDLIRRADDALYEAKRAGRNCVVADASVAPAR
jgi:diguanylate cyclase (GGDEF)-like protein